MSRGDKWFIARMNISSGSCPRPISNLSASLVALTVAAGADRRGLRTFSFLQTLPLGTLEDLFSLCACSSLGLLQSSGCSAAILPEPTSQAVTVKLQDIASYSPCSILTSGFLFEKLEIIR